LPTWEAEGFRNSGEVVTYLRLYNTSGAHYQPLANAESKAEETGSAMVVDKMGDEASWEGVEASFEDPEEERVIFNALDSFL
jgi:hypothetical protein